MIDNISTRDRSGAGFELDVLQLLHMQVAAVAARHETGRKGEDYDIQLQVRALDIPIEVKAKEDDG